jgi:hypothetical protein
MERDKVEPLRDTEYVDHIQNISINPFFTSRLIHSFMTGYEKAVVPLSLIFIIMPLIYYRPSRKLLITAKNSSTLRTLFVDDAVKATSLGGLQERLLYFTNITNQGVIVAANEGKINVTAEGLVLEGKLDYKDVLNTNIKEYIRAAHYLGLLCSKLELANIFRLLGVTLA